MKNDDYYMKFAIEQAKKAYSIGEVPVGAVIVCNDEIISYGYNCKECFNNVLKHAEIIAIDNACGKLNSWRLNNCVLYTTMEPCMMCRGAILESRIKKVVYGINKNSEQMFGSPGVEYIGGVLENECLILVQQFFKELRDK